MSRERDLKQLVEAKGFQLVSLDNTGRHIKALIQSQTATHLVTFSKTPSDWRSDMNAFQAKQMANTRPLGADNTSKRHARHAKPKTKPDDPNPGRILRRLLQARERESRAAAKEANWQHWLQAHDGLVKDIAKYSAQLNGHTPTDITQAEAILAKQRPLPQDLVDHLTLRFAKYHAEDARRASLCHVGKVGERVRRMRLTTISLIKMARLKYVQTDPTAWVVRLENEAGQRLVYTGIKADPWGEPGDSGDYSFTVEAHQLRDGDGLPETHIVQPRRLVAKDATLTCPHCQHCWTPPIPLVEAKRLLKKGIQTAPSAPVRPEPAEVAPTPTPSLPEGPQKRRRGVRGSKGTMKAPGTYSHHYKPAMLKLKPGKSCFLTPTEDYPLPKLAMGAAGYAIQLWGKGSGRTQQDKVKGRVKVTRLK